VSRIFSNVADLKEGARSRVPKPFFDWVENTAYGGITYRRNRADLDAIELRQRVMRDVSGRSTASTMLGQAVTMPVALAPTGLCGGVWPNGEILACRAAQRFGVPFTQSTNSVLRIEDIASAVEQPFWFQLYITKDRLFSEHLIERAKGAECPVLILTMDLHVEGKRHRDEKNGIGVPPRLTPGNVWSVISHPRWAFAMLGSKRWSFGNYSELVSPLKFREMAIKVKAQMDASFNATTLEWVRSKWPGKLIVKGILDPRDAVMAADAGADAVLVSNHGGRQLDGPAPASPRCRRSAKPWPTGSKSMSIAAFARGLTCCACSASEPRVASSAGPISTALAPTARRASPRRLSLFRRN
jgi:L-lactate dehydrogenase (cytochrome)